LVPDAHYKAVAEWVDSAHLRGRLVYFHVRARKTTELPALHRDSLVRKLAIKPDSPHYDWLERELSVRFDVACCATQEQFRRETRAVTLAGQIKDPSGRHEKDDRHRIEDRSRYVLGWSNSAKIAALEAKRQQLEARLAEVGGQIAAIQTERKALTSRLDALTRLEEFTTFDELDWASLATEIAQLVDERNRLAAASNVLQQLNDKLRSVQAAQKTTGEELQGTRDKRAKVEQRRLTRRRCTSKLLRCCTRWPSTRPWLQGSKPCAQKLWANNFSAWSPATTASKTCALGCKHALMPKTSSCGVWPKKSSKPWPPSKRASSWKPPRWMPAWQGPLNTKTCCRS
jgi:uncharacterized protein YPO0396